MQRVPTHLEKNKPNKPDKHTSQECLPTQFPQTTRSKAHATQRHPNSNTSASKQAFCNSFAQNKRTQNHMPSRDTQTATHELENNTVVNQFPHTSATKTTCHPEAPEQDALSDRNRTLNGEGARKVHNCKTTTASCALSVCRKTLQNKG